MTTYIAMNPTKRKQLTAAGWKVGSAADFLELTPEESVKCPNVMKPCHITSIKTTTYNIKNKP